MMQACYAQAIVCGVDKREGASLFWEVGGEEECTGSKRQAWGSFAIQAERG